jgi:GAF domain-containing protein
LNLRQGSGLHVGPLADMPAHRELAACWGGQLPRECLLLPVRLRDRLVTVLYLDAAGGPLGRIDLEGLQRLAAATARALERLILQKKKGSAAR